MEPRRSELPVGAIVDPTSVKRPVRTVLSGRFVDVVPLDAGVHGDALWAETRGPENDFLWAYLFDGPFGDRASFDAHLEKKAISEDPLFFAVVDRETGLATGHASLMRIEPVHRVIEVGNILYAPVMQRTAGATEAMYLMARHVFEDLGYRRYEWKCNALNGPSRSAALRLGFRFEGIFRQHLIVKNRNRDTAWFSMLDSEWPECRAAFERWLDPRNFDEQGRQRTPLAAFRG